MARYSGGGQTQKESASRSKPAASRGKHAVKPVWWLALGLTLGLFVAFLVYINANYRGAATPPAGDTTASPTPPKSETNKPRFEFYHMLPEMEVVVPDARAKRAPEIAVTPQPDKPPRAAPPQATQPDRYILQAGAFRTLEDADRRRASLALLGVESTIQTVRLNADETWYRVQVGPTPDVKKLNELRVRLEQNRVQTMLMRYKG